MNNFNITPYITVIMMFFTSVATLYVKNKIEKGNRKHTLNKELKSIILLSFKYPYLEEIGFTSTWQPRKADVKSQRYEIYCILIFNFLEEFCEYYRYDPIKIEEHLSIKSWVRIHKNCWEDPSYKFENTDGYKKEFRDLINGYLK